MAAAANAVAVDIAGSNSAPQLDASRSPQLNAVSEDAPAPSGAVGTLVSNLVDFAIPPGEVDNVTDADSGALLGIAVTAAETVNGNWFYSLDSGAIWTALGSVADNSARLLSADALTRLYFRPSANFNGSLGSAITLRAWDQTNGAPGDLTDTQINGGATAFSTTTDSASLTVTSVNDPPTALDDFKTINEDSGSTPITVLANDSIAPDSGETLQSVSVVVPPPNGTASFNSSTMQVDYTPNANFNGADVFTYRVFDSNGGSSTANVTVTVTSIPDPPNAVNDSRSVAEDSGTSVFDVLINDSTAPDSGETFSVTAVTQPANGTATFTPTDVSFTPNANFSGSTSFNYTIRDSGGSSDSASVSVTVTAVNDAPTINSAAPTTATEDTLYTYNATRVDPDGPNQIWSLSSDTCGGSIVAGTGTYTFTPTGPIPPVSCVVGVRDCDGGVPNLCATQTTTVTITADNDAPVINSVAPSTATEDVLYSYDASTALSDGPSENWSFGAGHTCGGSIGAGSGLLVFTPTGPAPPPSCNITIRLCDGTVPVDQCATQSTTVTISAENDPPTINSAAPTLATEDTQYSYSATRDDPDGPDQIWSLTSDTCGGFIVSSGVYTFTPIGPTPPASCVVGIRVCDDGVPNQCATQATTLTISADNDVPAIDTVAPSTATEDALYNYDANAAPSDGPSEDWSLDPAHTCGGSINAGSGSFIFTPTGPVPPPGCNLAIRLCDGTVPSDQCVTQTKTISIANNNEAPTLNFIPDPAPVPVGSGLRTVNLFGIGAGVGDPAQTLSVTALSDSPGLIPHPTVNYTSPNTTGNLNYTPVAGQQGAAVITVTVSDDGGTANGGEDSVLRVFVQAVDSDLIFINGFE